MPPWVAKRSNEPQSPLTTYPRFCEWQTESHSTRALTAHSALLLAGALAGTEEYSELGKILGMVAVMFAMINVVGGFLVTHRMLGMFRKKK